MSTHHDNPLDGMAAPAAPAGLRATVLREARAAAHAKLAPDIWTRLWESRTARIAWALTLAGLVLANVGISLDDPPRARSALYEPELAEIVDLPRLKLDVGARSLGRSEPAGDSDDSDENKERS